jgi:periplasmic divalent cation tolerance protein
MKEYSTIITTCPDKNSAKEIANILVENRLVACVQMFPIESVYRWKNEICNENEIVLLMKSKPELFDKIVATIKENHTYEVPEIIQIPITNGLPEYLNWIDDCVEKFETNK